MARKRLPARRSPRPRAQHLTRCMACLEQLNAPIPTSSTPWTTCSGPRSWTSSGCSRSGSGSAFHGVRARHAARVLPFVRERPLRPVRRHPPPERVATIPPELLAESDRLLNETMAAWAAKDDDEAWLTDPRP